MLGPLRPRALGALAIFSAIFGCGAFPNVAGSHDDLTEDGSEAPKRAKASSAADDDDSRSNAHGANGPGGAPASCAGGDATSPESLRQRVTFLASKELAGRAPGTPGDVAARQLVEDVFRCLALEPGAGNGQYQQPFTNTENAKTANVIGILRGTDPAVADQIVVIAAHHDHFGTIGGQGLRLGANDNASGVAGVLAVADALQRRGGNRRTIAFITFGSEETLEEAPWDEGSDFFVKHAPPGFPIEKVVHITTMDMIGTYDDQDNVDAMGTAQGTAGRTILQGLLGKFPGLDVTLDAEAEEGDSDFDPFCRLGVPYAGFYTEDSQCYHEACDTADRIDYEHMSQIVKLNVELTAGLASTTIDLLQTKRALRDACRFTE